MTAPAPMDDAARLAVSLAAACAEGIAPNLARWLRYRGFDEGEVFELQTLDRPRVAHATDEPTALRLLEEADRRGDAAGIFHLVNRPTADVAARDVAGQWHYSKKGQSTTDKDITHRRMLFVDIDANRTTGTSATDDEKARTWPIACAIYRDTSALVGADAVAIGDSGNGHSVLVALDCIGSDVALTATIKGILAALARLYVAEGVSIDPTVCDPKRLCPAFGTMKRKGAPGLADRPHRPTGIVVPDGEPKRLDRAALEALLLALQGRLPAEPSAPKATPPKRANPGPSSSASSPSPCFRQANDLPIGDVARWLGIDPEAPVCPGCSAGGDGDTSVAFAGNGLKCQHASCAKKGPPGFAGFRTVVDLTAEVKRTSARAAVDLLREQFGRIDPWPTRAPMPETDDDNEPGAPAAGRGRRFRCSDYGNAERLCAQHGADLRHCSALGWLAWDAARWSRDQTGEAMRRAKKTVRAIHLEIARETNEKRVKQLCEWSGKSEKAAALAAMVTLATTEPEIAIRTSDLDRDPYLFTVQNGTIDLRTGKLRSHDRADLCTKLAPVTYDAAALAPTWISFLERVIPSPAVRSFLQRWIGYCLTGDVREQALVFLYGLGANGKSTFLIALLALLGDYGRQAAPELLLAKREGMSAGDASAVADLFGARLVVATEIGAGRSFDEVAIKQMTGGDRIKAKLMRQDWWEFNPTHKLIVAANHKPRVRGTDHAIWRRLLLVPFDVTIRDADKDPKLPEKLRAELPGILRWAVEGCTIWQRDGLGVPDEVRTATDTYRKTEDTIGGFLADWCVTAPHCTVTSRDLYAAFGAWCEETGERAMSQKALGSALMERGFTSVRAGNAATRTWAGIGLSLAASRRPRQPGRGVAA